jgi:hypothetical protein
MGVIFLIILLYILFSTGIIYVIFAFVFAFAIHVANWITNHFLDFIGVIVLGILAVLLIGIVFEKIGKLFDSFVGYSCSKSCTTEDNSYQYSTSIFTYYDCPKCGKLYYEKVRGSTFVPQPDPVCENCGEELIRRPVKTNNKYGSISSTCPKGGSHEFEYYEHFGAQKRRCKKCYKIDPEYYIPNYYGTD